MHLIKKHGLKLSFANLLGILSYYIACIVSISVVFLIFMMFGLSTSLLNAENPAEIFDNPAVQGFMLILLLLYYLIAYILFFAFGSFLSAGLYGSAMDAAFRDQSSISSYFKNIFRHGRNMFLLYLGYLICFFPLIILFAIASATESNALILLSVLLGFILGISMLHTPIFLIHEGTGVWKSIGLSFHLLRKAPGKTLVSVLSLVFTTLVVMVVTLVGIILIAPVLESGLFSGAFQLILFIIGLVIVISSMFLGLPFAVSAGLLIVCDRYQRLLRPLIFPESKGNHLDDAEPSFAFNPHQKF